MKGQRLGALIKKNLKMIAREPAYLFMVILFPVVLTLAFGAAFGAINSGNGTQTYQVGVVNLDSSQWAQKFVGNLSEVEALEVKAYDTNETAQADLQQGRLAAVLVIPSNFGSSVESNLANPLDPSKWTNTTVALSVDQGSLVAKSTIPPVVQQALAATMYGKETTTFKSAITIGNPSLVEATKFSQFDYMVPGLFVYGIIFLVMTVSQPIVEDRQKGLLKRISVTPTTSPEIITSHVVSNTFLAEIQVGLIFGIAILMGFRTSASADALAFAFLITAVFAILNVGFGLIIATFAKSTGAATGMSFIAILPQMFLGSFVPAPQAVSMFVPSYYVTDSLSSLFLRGASTASPVIWMNFGVVLVWCAVILTLGIFLNKKYGRT